MPSTATSFDRRRLEKPRPHESGAGKILLDAPTPAKWGVETESNARKHVVSGSFAHFVRTKTMRRNAWLATQC
jgi:hypothetical protein